MNNSKLYRALGILLIGTCTATYYFYTQKHSESFTEGESGPNDMFFDQRTYPNQNFDVKTYQAAIAKANNDYTQSKLNKSINNKLNNVSWKLEGAGNIGGRFNCIAIDPTNSQIMYAGSANGGVWKTVDNGANWLPITDDLPYQSIGAIAINPSNSNEIWIGTGDNNINGTMYTGNGVYKSTNGGATWASLGLANTYIVSMIKFNTQSPNEVLISTMGNPFNKDANRGVYKTINGGVTFTNTLFTNDSTGVIDMVQHPTNPAIVYACSYTRIRTNRKSAITGTENYIYKSTNFGQTWTKLAGGLPNGNVNERIGITICKSNANTLYALYSTSNSTTPSLYKTINGGVSWSNVSISTFDNNSYGGFGWYFGKIYVDDNDPNLVYIPGVDLQYSTDGGVNWSLRTPPWYIYEVHADGHYIHFNSSTDFIYCTDGGLYRTLDGGNTWSDIENIAVNQFYSITENPFNYGEYAGGVQDNGTMSGNFSSFNNYTRIFGGDGFKLEYTQNPQLVYAESQNGNIVYTNNYVAGSSSWTSLDKDPSQNYNWFTPYFVSLHNQNTVFLGGQQVMRIDNAPYGVFTNISPVLHGANSPARVSNISTLEQSVVDSLILYAGTADGKVWNTLNYGTTWTDVTPFTGISYYVTKVHPSPNNSATAYVTRSGYRANDNTPLVFKSINNGGAWTNISGNLPPLAINDIEVLQGNENVVFIANDAGVYYTLDAGVNWGRVGNNMPFVATIDIKFNYNNSKLIAGTYGRGIYTINVNSVITNTNTITNTVGFKVFPNPTTDAINITSNKTISRITLFDTNGKQILTTKQTHIDVAHLSKGNYIIVAEIEGKTERKKIIIN